MTENQKKPPPSHILRSRGAHTQLSRTSSMRGNVATEKGELVTGKIKERWWKGVFYWNFTKKSYRLSVSERLSFLRIR